MFFPWAFHLVAARRVMQCTGWKPLSDLSWMFKSPQAGLSKDPPCIIVYLEFSCGVIGQVFCVLSGITEKRLFIFKQIGMDKKKGKKLQYKKIYSTQFQKNLPQGLMYSGIRLDLRAVNRRKISSLERWGLKLKSNRKTLGSSNQEISPFGPGVVQKCRTNFQRDPGIWIQLLHIFPFRCILKPLY